MQISWMEGWEGCGDEWELETDERVRLTEREQWRIKIGLKLDYGELLFNRFMSKNTSIYLVASNAKLLLK